MCLELAGSGNLGGCSGANLKNCPMQNRTGRGQAYIPPIPMFGFAGQPGDTTNPGAVINRAAHVPFIAFNKEYSRGNMILYHTHIPYNELQKPVSTNFIYPGSDGNLMGNTYIRKEDLDLSATSTNYNAIYPPTALGNGILSNCHRKIKGIHILASRAYINGAASDDLDNSKKSKKIEI